ncbi:MAG: filamentous hemagglutinin N-terminal domain-containing protein, partial [Methylococcaceae bacterium]
GQLRAAVVTDGTLGPATALQGRFEIGQNLGTRVGPNLFHSFRSFNLGRNESATFTGDADLARVISRVTGGKTSHIDGLLRSKVGRADFYFINPAGIVFGPDAQIDVPASLYLSTATELRFGDGGVFSATHPDAGSLSVQAPVSFGFLQDRRGEIRFDGDGDWDEAGNWQGTSVELSPGSSLDLVAQDVAIAQTRLASPQGVVTVATAQQGEVPLHEHSPEAPQGSVTISQAYLDSSGAPAGKISLATDQLVVRDSWVYADGYGDVNSVDGGVDVRAHDVQLDHARLTANALQGSGQAGNITLQVEGTTRLVNGAQLSTATGPDANAAAGDIVIDSGELSVDSQNSGLPTAIFSDTYNAGAAGDITIRADQVELANNGLIASSAYVGSSGDGGSIDIHTDKMLIDNSRLNTADPNNQGAPGGVIAATYGAGKAGDIAVHTGTLKIQGQVQAYTGIFTNALENTSGQTGHIAIQADDWVRLWNYGWIRSENYATLDHPEQIQPQSIAIRSPLLYLNEGAAISTIAAGNTAAGDIDLDIGEVLGLNLSTISTRSVGADGGNIRVSAPVTLLSDGFIQANSDGLGGQGGRVDVQTQALIPSQSILLLNQHVSFNPGILLQQNNAANVIQSAAPQGLSGTVSISTPQLDISGSISHLSARRFDARQLFADYCRVGLGSSLQQFGAGALPRRAGEALVPAVDE